MLHHSLKNALKRVSMSEYKPEKQALLIEFLEASNGERSVAKVTRFYKKDELKRLFKLLENIDTNYVTATHEAAKLFEYGYIPTPMELIKDFA